MKLDYSKSNLQSFSLKHDKTLSTEQFSSNKSSELLTPIKRPICETNVQKLKYTDFKSAILPTWRVFD